ncbi:DUF6053 domain-containing protein [Lysobacter enzymogenes]|uniref:DUF6053 domain-containing protein n=1 Tax=Lysobacter enzymogenes TaxID=69 RepID=UPI003D2F8203
MTDGRAGGGCVRGGAVVAMQGVRGRRDCALGGIGASGAESVGTEVPPTKSRLQNLSPSHKSRGSRT